MGRRIAQDPILIVGTYRPDEIISWPEGGSHPLLMAITELKRNYGEIEIDLEHHDRQENQAFVDALLDTEPNRLDEAFRQALCQHTGGHPLFTVELLRQMQTQGDIEKDDEGCWAASPGLGWDAMPARVEAVIAGRINRLPRNLREIVKIASVEGEEFTTEAIALVSGRSVPEIIGILSAELQKRFLLVEAEGIQRLGNQSLSLYQFHHHLFQKYVYDNLDPVERAHLHERVGRVLESLWGDRAIQHPGRLARHFETAGVADKAIDYLLQAADSAKRLSANEEAISYLSRGLALLDKLREGHPRDKRELALRTSLGAPLVAIQGYTAPEAEATFELARLLCEQVGEPSQRHTALWGLWSFYLVRGGFNTALDMAKQILHLAQTEPFPDLILVGHWTVGITLCFLGEFSGAREQLDQAVAQYDSARHLPLTYLYGQNPGVTCLVYSALPLWFLGYPDQGLERCKRAVRLADEVGHLYSKSFAHGMTAIFHSIRQEPEAALEHSQETMRIAREAGFAYLTALGLVVRGWARASLGKTPTNKMMASAIDSMQAIGAELGRPYFLSLLAEVYGMAGEVDKGLNALDLALEAGTQTGERLVEADMYRIQAQLLEARGADESEWEASYRRCHEIAQQQGARSIELRALVGLTKLMENRGQEAKMRTELTELYEGFTEGLETHDLVEARDILDATSDNPIPPGD